jgi:hypothetical protein
LTETPRTRAADVVADDERAAVTADELIASATRLGMRTDATDWSRVATVAARSGAGGRRVAGGATGRPLRSPAPDWP